MFLRSFLRKLSPNQKLTLLIAGVSALSGVGSLITSVVALLLTLESSDTATAVKRLGELAHEAQVQSKALQAQNTLALQEFATQRDQATALSRQAQASAKLALRASDQVAISREQLQNSVRELKIYQEGANFARSEAVQAYRRVNLSLSTEGVPASSEAPFNYHARFENNGDVPITETQSFLAAMLSKENPTVAARTMFAKGLKTIKAARANLTIGPKQYHGIGDHLDNSFDRYTAFSIGGYRLIVVAIFEFRDPQGGLHHEYACRSLAVGQNDRPCGSPPND